MTLSSKAIAVCALMILLGSGAFSFRTAMRLEEELGWVTHTHLVLERLQSVLIDISQAEAGEQGYQLTGKSWYVGEYEADLNQVGQDLKELQHLTSDNLGQQKAIERLEPVLGARLAELSDEIEFQKRSGTAAEFAGGSGADRGELMNGIRKQIGEMRATEEQLLVSRLATAQGGTLEMKGVIVMGNAFAILTLLVAGFVMNREYVRHSWTELELKRANQGLTERTAELLEANRPEV